MFNIAFILPKLNDSHFQVLRLFDGFHKEMDEINQVELKKLENQALSEKQTFIWLFGDRYRCLIQKLTFMKISKSGENCILIIIEITSSEKCRTIMIFLTFFPETFLEFWVISICFCRKKLLDVSLKYNFKAWLLLF